MKARLLILVTCLGMLIGCGRPAQSPQLTIAAAASLAPPFGPIAAQYQQDTGVQATLSYASTAALAEQIRQGGPFDLFAAADAEHVDALIAEGLLDADSRVVFARGRLVLAVGPGRSELPGSLEGLLSPEFRRVVIANPAFAPYGLAARQALERSGLWERIEPRVIYAETVRQAGQVLQSGNADAGLLAASTAISAGLLAADLPADLHDPILHVAAVRSGSEQADAARAFLQYLGTPKAAAILDQFGLSAAAP